MSARAAAAVGATLVALVTSAALLAWRDGSPLVPRNGGLAGDRGAPLFLALVVAAYAAYLGGLWLVRRGATRMCVLVVAVLVQVAPLGAPLLLSTDAWTYWSYGWTAANGGNPYVDHPSTTGDNPAAPFMGQAWLETTSVYGPAFTLASEPVARLAGDSDARAAWIFKALAAAAVVAAALLATRLSTRPSLAAAFVGWNPVLALHAGGGGHNDAWLGALVLAALALEGGRRTWLAGMSWSLAVLVKWIPAPLLGLHLLSPLTPVRTRLAAAVGLSLAVGVSIATWRYGVDWLGAAAPLAENALRETRYALPARLEQAGVPDGVALALAGSALVAGGAWLAVSAARGRVRLGAASCLLLLTTPYLAVWYLAWAVPVAAVEDDERLARACILLLGAYLLPQTVPL